MTVFEKKKFFLYINVMIEQNYYTILCNIFTYYRDTTNKDDVVTGYMDNGTFSGLNLNNVGELYTAFERVTTLTQALTGDEHSVYYHNSNLYHEISSRLNELTAYYNGKTKQSGNWWYWRIGIPNMLLKTLALYKYFIIDVIGGESEFRFDDTFRKALDKFVVANTKTDMTYANLASICRNVFMMSVIYEEDKLYNTAINDVVPAFEQKSNSSIRNARCIQRTYVKIPFLPYNIKMFAGKEGIYDDYTFIQHTSIPYIGTYGLEILEYAALLSYVDVKLHDDVVKMLPKWINAFELAIYDGQMLLSYCGRSVETVDTVGQASIAHKYINEIKSSYNVELLAVSENFSYVQSNADTALFRGNGWQFVIKMSSDRIARYESFNGQNINGFKQGDGMTYLYVKGNEEYKYGYFSKINPLLLPGSHVVYEEVKTPYSTSEQPRFDYYPSEFDYLKAGGVNCDEEHATACMCNKYIRKAWFRDENKIICVGSHSKNTVFRVTPEYKIGYNNIYYLNEDNEWTKVEEGSVTLRTDSRLYIDGVGGYLVCGNKIVVGVEDNASYIKLEDCTDKYLYVVIPGATMDEVKNIEIPNVTFSDNGKHISYSNDTLYYYTVSFDDGNAVIIKNTEENSDIWDYYLSDFFQSEEKKKYPVVVNKCSEIIDSDIDIKLDIDKKKGTGKLILNTKDLLGKTVHFKLK